MNPSERQAHKYSRLPVPPQVGFVLIRTCLLLIPAGIDTYTEAELKAASLWCMSHFKGVKQTWVGLRDRAMLLFSAATAVRGENARILRWSDLFMSEIPMDSIHMGLKIPVHVLSALIASTRLTNPTMQVLAALADNAKHNQKGRVDEYGAIRHRDVESCPVGSCAKLFFAYFHILGNDVPKFLPDFDTDGYGEYGYREWYDYCVFWGKDAKQEMSYDSKFSSSIPTLN